MPVKEKTTYISIPPPPLPEFYLAKRNPKESSSSGSSSSSSMKVDEQAVVVKNRLSSGDGALDVKPRGSKLALPPPAPLVAMPPALGYSS